MSKHTPGPWHFQTNKDQFGDIEFAVFSGTEEEKYYPGMLKWIIGGKSEKSPLSEGDARLIAAAPELLDALKGLLESLNWAQLGGYQRKQFQNAKTAIAKAEGNKNE